MLKFSDLSVKDIVARIMNYAYAQRGVKSVSDMHLPIFFVLYCLHKNFAPRNSPLNFTPESKYDKLYNDLSEASGKYVSGFRLDGLHSFCHGLCFENREFFDNNYVSILLELNKAIYSNTGINGGEFYTPAEISSLIAYFIEKEECKSVFDPFCGTANLVRDLHTMEGNVCFEGQDVNSNISLIARVFTEACTGADAGIKCTDSIDDWNEKHYDAVCSCPPFGLKFPTSRGLKEEFHQPRVILEDIIFGRAFRNNSANVVVLLEPLGFAFRDGNERNLRRYLVENNFLDTIISLPSNLLYGTSIVSILMVCKRNRQEGQPITLIDASKSFVKNGRSVVLDIETIINLIQHPESENCAQVNADEIRENDYILTPSSYIVRELEKFPEGYQVAILKDLIESVPQNRKYSDKEGKLVTISQLSTDAADYKRSPESFEISNELKNAYKVDEAVLLLSTIGTLKPAYCIASPENPIFVHPHVRAFRLKEKWVNPGYLCLQLSKSKGYSVGGIIPHINLVEILKIKVAFPSIGTQQSFDEQSRLYNEAVESAKLAKANELGLQEVINKMKAEYMIEVRNRKHDMKTPMTQLRNTLTLLDAFAKGLPEEQSLKLQGYINRQRTAVDTLSEIVRHLADEETFATPEALDIDDILRSFEEKNDRYEIEYMADEAALNEIGDGRAIVKMGKSDFLRLVNNIVGNAIQHGFVDNSVRYGLFISLTVIEGAFRIRFFNNGKQLPEGMDKARYGMKGVKGKDSKGQGTGGSVVKSVTEHYGGDYDIYTMDADGKVITVVDIKLPIYQEDE